MKELVYLVICVWSLLFMTLVECFDDRRPGSTKLKYKYRVKENSIFRKIIKFKDKEDHPCNYFKIVPFYVFLLLTIISSILLIVDIVFNNFITNIVPKKIFLIITMCIYGISVLYFLVIVIW